MLVFRKGQWKEIVLPLVDPVFSEEHKKLAASIAASSVKTGDALMAVVEEALYKRLYPGLLLRKESPLLLRKEHGGPKD
jgi:hypothetical protein